MFASLLFLAIRNYSLLSTDRVTRAARTLHASKLINLPETTGAPLFCGWAQIVAPSFAQYPPMTFPKKEI